MTKTRWLILVIVIAAVVALAFLADHLHPTPTYEGRTTAEWMMEAIKNSPRQNPQAIFALRQIGEPAVLELARMVEDEDSKLKRQLVLWSEKIPTLEQLVSSSHWYRLFAAKVLATLGPDAKNAIPALEKMAASSDDMLQRAAQAALICIRQEPLEPYIKLYQEHSGKKSARMFGLLMELGPAAKTAIPVLLGELESTNSRIRLTAVNVLGSVGVESPECVAPLIKRLSDTNETVRLCVIGALGNFGGLARPAFSKVSTFIEDENPQLRSSALCCLWRAAAKEDLIPYRVIIENATNDVDATVKTFAEMILNDKLDKP